MSPVTGLVRRLRSTLLPFGRFVPKNVGPAPLRHLARDGRVEAAKKYIETDPAQAVILLEAELDASAPPRVWRLAAQAAAAAKDYRRVIEWDGRAVEQGYATFTDVLRLRKAAMIQEDQTRIRQAIDYLLTLTATRSSAVRQSAPVLKHAESDQLDALVAFRERAAQQPRLDVAALDEAILQVRLRERLGRGIPLDEVLDGMLTDPAATGHVIRALMGERRFDDLEGLVERLDPEHLAAVSVSTWRHLTQRATSLGWSGLAARSAELALAAGADDAEGKLAHAIATGQDETQTMAIGWAPPPRSASEEGERDPRSVVSVLGQSLPLRSGGYATRSHGIVSSLVRRGWTMNAVTRLGFPYDLWWSHDDDRVVEPMDLVDGVPYHRLLTEGVRDYPRTPLVPYVEEGARGIARLGRAKKASLIHASSLYDVGMAGLLAARELGVPFVYEMRGLKQLLESARQPQFADSPRSRYLDLLESTVAREADALLVITEALGRQMVELGVDPARITVVPNGVDISRFEPRGRNEELAAQLGVSDKTVIGYVGGLVHYEGLDLLFEAAAQLGRDRDDLHVLIVGDGAHERALRRNVDELGIEHLVTFTGRVPHEEVEGYLSLVDITPFPRKPLPVCELISPIKPFEAMAMEKAVVASDVAALAEIVQDGQTGRLFAKGDAHDLARVLAELLDDPQQRTRLGQRAREWVVAERDWDRITDTVDEIYASLLPVSTEA